VFSRIRVISPDYHILLKEMIGAVSGKPDPVIS
jgi:hypothetical protein